MGPYKPLRNWVDDQPLYGNHGSLDPSTCMNSIINKPTSSFILLTEEIQTTTWHVQNPGNNGINYLSTGAGFLLSTVWVVSLEKKI